jgi:hypothetical protein
MGGRQLSDVSSCAPLVFRRAGSEPAAFPFGGDGQTFRADLSAAEEAAVFSVLSGETTGGLSFYRLLGPHVSATSSFLAL